MRYIFGILLALLLVIVLIILVIGGGSKPKAPPNAKTLNSYAASDAKVSMLIDGPVNAESLHDQVRITAGRDSVVYEQINGYDGSVGNRQSFANTQNAYANFLSALGRAGYTKGDSNEKLADNRGYCPQGTRYIFELYQGDKQLQRYWATNCSGAKTYLGNLNLTILLFQAQVPNYNTLITNLTLQ